MACYICSYNVLKAAVIFYDDFPMQDFGQLFIDQRAFLSLPARVIADLVVKEISHVKP